MIGRGELLRGAVCGGLLALLSLSVSSKIVFFPIIARRLFKIASIMFPFAGFGLVDPSDFLGVAFFRVLFCLISSKNVISPPPDVAEAAEVDFFVVLLARFVPIRAFSPAAVVLLAISATTVLWATGAFDFSAMIRLLPLFLAPPEPTLEPRRGFGTGGALLFFTLPRLCGGGGAVLVPVLLTAGASTTGAFTAGADGCFLKPRPIVSARCEDDCFGVLEGFTVLRAFSSTALPEAARFANKFPSTPFATDFASGLMPTRLLSDVAVVTCFDFRATIAGAEASIFGICFGALGSRRGG
jgi:hypothetical protein